MRSARLRCFANCPALAPVDPGLVFRGSTWRAAASPAAPGEESPTARAQLTAAESGDCSGQELSEPGGPGTSGPESRSELLQTFPALFGLAAAAAKKSKAAERGATRSDARAAPLAPASELDRREPLPPGAPSPSPRKRAQSPGVRAAETRRHCGAPRRAAPRRRGASEGRAVSDRDFSKAGRRARAAEECGRASEPRRSRERGPVSGAPRGQTARGCARAPKLFLCQRPGEARGAPRPPARCRGPETCARSPK